MATLRNRNTVASSKLHFFQPLLPGFEHQFSIPVKIFKSLERQGCDKAILRTRIGKSWPVKINGRQFEDGWKEFVQNHDLHVGYFLVFKHQGDMVFDVLVFDTSSCEKEFPSFAAKQFHVKEEIIEIQEEEEEHFPQTGCPGKSKNKEKMNIRTTLDAKATTFSLLEHPYFMANLTTSSARQRKLYIPTRFARLHGLMNRHCKLILLDQEGRSWPAYLWYKKSDGQVYIGRGWKSCRVANDLKAGDSFIIQLIEKGKRPILKLSRLKVNLQAKKELIHHYAQDRSDLENTQPKIPEELAKESSSSKLIARPKKKQPVSNLKVKASSVLQHPYFATKVTHSNVIRNRMYIPKPFAKRNNLINRHCEMIIMDQEGKSFQAKLWYKVSKGEAYIHGWNASSVANDLKPGDPIIFELIRKGNIPVLKMHKPKANLEAKMEPVYHDLQVEPSSITPTKFGVTMKASDLENSWPKVRDEEQAKESSSYQLHTQRAKFSSQNPWKPAKSSSVLQHPYFATKVTSSSRTKMYIPKQFAKQNNLINRHCEMIIMDQEGRSWRAKLWYKVSRGEAYIVGWNASHVRNDLKPGDPIIFELIEKGNMPVFKLHSKGLQANFEAKIEPIYHDAEVGPSSIKPTNFGVTMKASDLENFQPEVQELAKESSSWEPYKKRQPMITIEAKASSSVQECSYFVVQVTPSSVLYNKMYIPTNVKMLSNLSHGYSVIILVDEEERSWPAKLWYRKSDGHAHICDWNAFRVANDLNPGDSFIFEFIEDRKLPILKMCNLKAKLKAIKEQSRRDVETGSSSTRHPYFYVTAKASHFKNCVLKIPRNFVRRNNIMRKCSEMMFQNERGRSWLVSLVRDKAGDAYFGGGWTKFAKANGIRKGDVFMLELVEGGKKPIMKFYGSNKGTICNKIYNDAQRGGFEDSQDVKPIIE